MALAYIVDSLCRYHDEAFYAEADGGDRATAYALGRRSVARELFKLINFDNAALDQLRQKEDKNG